MRKIVSSNRKWLRANAATRRHIVQQGHTQFTCGKPAMAPGGRGNDGEATVAWTDDFMLIDWECNPAYPERNVWQPSLTGSKQGLEDVHYYYAGTDKSPLLLDGAVWLGMLWDLRHHSDMDDMNRPPTAQNFGRSLASGIPHLGEFRGPYWPNVFRAFMEYKRQWERYGCAGEKKVGWSAKFE